MAAANDQADAVRVSQRARFHCPKCGSEILGIGQETAERRLCPVCRFSLWCSRRVEGHSVLLDVLPGATPEIGDMTSVGHSIECSSAIREVVVSLARLEVLTSSFVAGLLGMRRLLEPAGCKLVLRDLRPRVLATLRRLNLHGIFLIES